MESMRSVRGISLLVSAMAAGCSNSPAPNVDGTTANPQVVPSATTGGTPAAVPAAGSGGAVQTAPGTASGGSAGAPGSVASNAAGTASTPVAAVGGAGATATSGTGGASAMPMNAAQPDCKSSDWKDAATVPNPMVVAVAADAGKTHKLWGQSKGISEQGYLEEEFLFTGSSPAYTTRMVVHRHKDAAKFSGTVFMEWYNVTGGIDIAPLWALSRDYMMREGHVHVGVSAQAVGANALKDYDSERYAMIKHPGDTAANAIFSQAAMAIRSQGEKLLGPCMPVRSVLALGQSQSAAMLGAYLSGAHPKDHVYDGFVLHSDPTGGTPSNPNVPVFVVATMNEGNGKIANQTNLVEWEVAGASHNDATLTNRGNEEQGSQLDVGVKLECSKPLNDFPSYWVYDAVLDWLNRWVRKGEMPPNGPPFQTRSGGGLQLDEHGNVQGGVRIQDIDVPIATYTNSNAAASALDILSALGCGLGGSVDPFNEQKLTQLYPTHDEYVQKYTAAADIAVAGGYLLPADREIAIERAKKAPIPK